MALEISEPTPVTAVGVDFGGTFIKLGVCRGGELLETDEPIPTGAHSGPIAQVDVIAERVKAMRARHPGIAAVGVGVPGLVDFDRGYVHVLTNVPGWNGVQLRDLLAVETGLPVTVENDANAMTYAEWRYGAARGLKNVIGITLGTGVGGGVVLDGQMYRGSRFSAGEIGQMSIAFNGVNGHYGNFGALEKYIGNQQIGEHAARVATCRAACTASRSNARPNPSRTPRRRVTTSPRKFGTKWAFGSVLPSPASPGS